MNNFIFFIIPILIAPIIFLIFKGNKKTKKINYVSSSNKKNFDFLGIDDVKIPEKIKELDIEEVLENIQERFKIFTILKYLDKKEDDLYDSEWNSWEMGLFIYALQSKRNFLIPEPTTVFHKVICNLNKKQVEEELKNIFLKFNKISLKESIALKSQIIWSPREVSIILYYFVLVREF